MQGIFISHSTVDRPAAFALAERLKAEGYRCFLDFQSIAGGEEWERKIYDSLRQSVAVLLFASPEACDSRWVFAEISIARFHDVPVIPLIMKSCDVWSHVAATAQHIDFRSDPRSAYSRLLESLAPLRLKADVAAYAPDRSPYRGLDALQEQDAAVFFGRDRELADAVAALRPGGRQRRFLAVVGPSGSGKSSFVKAGLLPALKGGAIPGSSQWLYVLSFTPGETPFQNFAAALCALDKNFASVGEVEGRLRKDGGLLDVVLTARAHLGALDAQVVVVLDQLEEIERRTAKSEANAFLESLAGAVHAPNTPLIVVATLRADFLSECLQFPALAPLLSSDSLLLGAMDRAALAEAIRGPARVAGVEFEPGLVEQIVDETGGGDALPLMADALHQLWRASAGRSLRRISSEDYRAMGGVREGLSRRAQELFDELPEEARSPLHSVLVRLADVNERGDFTRRRLPRDLIPEQAKTAVERFVDARLLQADAEEVAVSHEALLRNWSLLRGWLEDESDRLRLRRQIEMDAREWDDHGRAEEYLWRPGRLAAARGLMEEERWQESDLRRQFLAAAQSHEHAGRERESEQLANRVLADYERDPELGILLASTAIETYAWTPRAELALNTALDGSALRGVFRHEGSVESAAFSPDGTRIVTASGDDAARVWDAQSGQLLHILLGHEDSVLGAAFSPDGSRIVTASDDDTARVWDAQSGQLLHILLGHENTVLSAVFSLDGSRIVTASEDQNVCVWDARSGQPLHTLRDHEDIVFSAAFSSDGSRVLTASHDETARVWDAQSGQLLRTLSGHESPLWSVAFSPDGLRIVTASDDHTVRVWDAQSGHLLNTLGGHESLSSASFSPDGSRIVTTSDDHTARVWDVQSAQPLYTFRGHEDTVWSAAFSPDGSRIVTASEDHTARIWDAQSGQLLHTLRGHEDRVSSAAFSHDGSRIVTASVDKTARVWDAQSGEPLHTLRGHENWVQSAAFSPDGSHIVTGSEDHTARVWDAQSGRPLHTLRGHDKTVLSAAFSPDGSRILTASYDSTARVWDAQSGQPLYNLRGHDKTVLSAAFSPDGSRIVTASYDHTARVWDAQSGEPLHTLRGHENWVQSTAFSPDGSRIVTASVDKTARVWDAQSGQPLHTLHGHENWVRSAAFSPDGSRIVTASDDHTARIWDAHSGRPLHTLRGHEKTVSSIAFSPDGSRIVTASSDHTARVWDAESNQPLHTLRGHEKTVWSAAFSPDGSRIVTASSDNTARVWDAQSGQPLHILRGHEDTVLSAAFSPDGLRIVTASADKTARVWNERGRESLLAIAHTRVFRQLTAQERRSYGLPLDAHENR